MREIALAKVPCSALNGLFNDTKVNNTTGGASSYTRNAQ